MMGARDKCCWPGPTTHSAHRGAPIQLCTRRIRDYPRTLSLLPAQDSLRSSMTPISGPRRGAPAILDAQLGAALRAARDCYAQGACETTRAH